MRCDSNFVEQGVSRETLRDLEVYADLLTTWTSRINLISPTTIEVLWHRHIADSVQLFPHIPKESVHVTDFGTGGGLPGVVLAILSRKANSERRFTFIESDRRKSVFLRRCVQALDLNARVQTDRVETVHPLNAEVVVARGFAPLDVLLPLTARHMAKDGTALFPKGRSFAAEIDAARQSWDFHLETHQSISDPEARLLLIKDIKRAE